MDAERKIKRNRAQCLVCMEVIESRFRHEFVECSCGAIFVDGGKAYLRRGARDFSKLLELSEYEDDPPLV